MMRNVRYSMVVLAVGLFFGQTVHGKQLSDTLSGKTHILHEVYIHAQPLEMSATVPAQQLGRKAFEAMGAQNVADVARHFAGINIKDYGGIGGLKTVSVRGLNAAHTAVSYDGVVLSNCQAGQIDVGRYSLNNVGKVSLYVGQEENLLSSARALASGSVLHIESLLPTWNGEKNYQLKASLTGGSFGQVNPSLYGALNIRSHTIVTAGISHLQADGNYPFKLKNGLHTTHEKRNNSAVQSQTMEVALFHWFNDSSRLDGKIYYYQGKRGLPGAVIYYNSQSRERLEECNAFAQLRYKKQWQNRWALQASGKYNNGRDLYTDRNIKYEHGVQTDRNRQNEYYLQATASYQPFQMLELSVAQDGVFNTLKNNLPNCLRPKRLTSLSAFQARMELQDLTLHACLLNTFIHESVQEGKASADKQKLAPSISLSVKPFNSEDLRLRLLYKETYRVPSFNDLYYFRSGNKNLRPEKAHEYNIGITYCTQYGGTMDNLSLTVDGYHNQVKDKIVAFPTTYVWKMANFGKVAINGLDATLNSTILLGKGWWLQLNGSYSLQQAVDRTDAQSNTYGNQLPYTPVHSGSALALLETPWVKVGYTALVSSERYSMSEQTDRYRLAPYFEQGVTLSFPLRMGGCLLSVQGEVINLANRQYDIIQYYPMPGRQFRLRVQLTL